jgi:ABC-type transport system involved in multi-copper enzyme maturation permease subunit
MMEDKSNKIDKKKVNSEKSINNTFQSIKSWFNKNISKRIFVIIKKTFFDIYSLKKFIIIIIFFSFIPIISFFLPTAVNFGLISSHHAATIIGFAIIPWAFMFFLGSFYAVIIGLSGSSLIAEEISSGTMLILVSKPISRIKIFLGKYLAVILYGMLISFISIFTIGWLGVLIKSGNIDHFISLLPFLTALYLYSLFILFLFTSITMALSSIFKKSRNVSIIILVLVIFAYLGFFIIRTIVGQFYVTFQLYHFDLGYHLGNVFILFIESLNAIPPSASWQLVFATFTGVYSLTSTTDPDQGINLGGLEKTNYYLPIFSLLIWVLIATLLLIFGIFSLKKREISV